MMADRLTQLQDCLDQLLTQMYASLRFIETQAPPADVPGQPTNPGAAQEQPTVAANAAGTHTQSGTHNRAPSETPRNGHRSSRAPSQAHAASEPLPDLQTPAPADFPAAPEPTFDATLNELAVDLTLKLAQIMVLIDGLPGIGQSEAAQRARIVELERELTEVEKEREGVFREWEDLWGLTANLATVGDMEQAAVPRT